MLYVEQDVVEERGLVVAAILRGVVHVRRGDGVGETAVFLGVAGQAPIHSSAVRKRGGSKAHNNTCWVERERERERERKRKGKKEEKKVNKKLQKREKEREREKKREVRKKEETYLQVTL